MSLLPRFYDPDAGAVLIDGVDIREYSLHDLRAQMSLVSQDVVLFDDTIRNNILFGAGGVDAAAVEAAACAAHVMEFVEDLPQGLDTPVGDRGMLLSGGQRQRIAIARALLRNTPILILDEATSALDTASERHIQAALEQLVQNRTTFVIAHRLSTIEHADRIVVMQEGASSRAARTPNCWRAAGCTRSCTGCSSTSSPGTGAARAGLAPGHLVRARRPAPLWLRRLAALFGAVAALRRAAYRRGWLRSHAAAGGR